METSYESYKRLKKEGKTFEERKDHFRRTGYSEDISEELAKGSRYPHFSRKRSK